MRTLTDGLRAKRYVSDMTVQTPGICRIGCAGWAIPRDARDAFPQQGSHLECYAQVLGMVEINTSFYRPHRPQTYVRWGASVPDGFRFSVKLPRTISHDARLRGADALLARFAGEVSALGERLGCILVQLPPKQEFDAAVADAFFALARAAFSCMIACEARHPSWFGDDATAVLARHGVTRVIADPPAGQPGAHVPTTASIYLRLHGAPRVYYSDYADGYLEKLAQDIRIHTQAGRDVWCVFDNTMSKTFMRQALYLLERAVLRPAPRPGPQA